MYICNLVCNGLSNAFNVKHPRQRWKVVKRRKAANDVSRGGGGHRIGNHAMIEYGPGVHIRWGPYSMRHRKCTPINYGPGVHFVWGSIFYERHWIWTPWTMHPTRVKILLGGSIFYNII